MKPNEKPPKNHTNIPWESTKQTKPQVHNTPPTTKKTEKKMKKQKPKIRLTNEVEGKTMSNREKTMNILTKVEVPNPIL